MLDSIYIGMSGLLGYSRGLKNIANNTANMNTPGFKESTLQFTDLFYADQHLRGQHSQLGSGLNTGGTMLNFKQGELRSTGNALDMAVDGSGLFTLMDGAGKLHYSRAGQFEFNADGVLCNRSDGARVMGLEGADGLHEISIAGLHANPPKATTSVKFSGNLSSTGSAQSVTGVTVFDHHGGQHALSLQLTNGSADNAGTWLVNVLDGSTLVGSGSLAFVDGHIVPSSASLAFHFSPVGVASQTVTLDFSTAVSSLPSGNLSSLAMSAQDGYAAGSITGTSFDDAGILLITYSNGQSVQGRQLALSHFASHDAIKSRGGNQFDAVDGTVCHRGRANDGLFGVLRTGTIEVSNVDLSQELSVLVVMQRGFQSSSQIISTANEMLQQLFSLKGK
jgi:flagellar hook protein FlgE